MSKADEYLKRAFDNLSINPERLQPDEIFARQDDIRIELDKINNDVKAKDKNNKGIQSSTTGAITEKICEYGLKAVLPNGYSRLGQSEKWIGDFNLIAYPIGAVISVKSFTAKERLLASGLGIILVPTIAFTWMKEPDEFKPKRCNAYRDRGFLAIYMPQNTLKSLRKESRHVKNSNGKPLLRSTDDMIQDFKNAIKLQKYGDHKVKALYTREF